MQRVVGFLIVFLFPALVVMLPAMVVHAAVSTLSSPVAGGNVYGTVVLEDGSRVPGVTVTVKGAGAPAITISSAEGAFRFLRLRPGDYDFKFELEGFKTVERKGIRVGTGRSVTLNVVMATAVVQEDLVVTGQSPLDVRGAAPGTSSRSVSRRVSDNSLEALPTITRSFNDIIRISPFGEQGAAAGQAHSSQKVDDILDPLINSDRRHPLNELKDDLKTAQGREGKLQVITDARNKLAETRTSFGGVADTSFLDNAEKALNDLEKYFNSDAYNPTAESNGFSQVNIRGGLDAVDVSPDYGVSSSGYLSFGGITINDLEVDGYSSAEYGRFSGAVINVITKSGGNDFSGSTRLYFDDDWSASDRSGDADNYWAGSQQDYFGGSSLGGPIIKDKLWFFTSFGSGSGRTNPVTVNNATSDNSYSIQVGGQSTTIGPGISTSFNPNPSIFSGFYSSPYTGPASTASVAAQPFRGLFYPRTTQEALFGGYGGTTLINPDFVDPGALGNWGYFRLGGTTNSETPGAHRGSLEYLFDTSWGDHALKFGFESNTFAVEGRYSGILSGSQFRLLRDSAGSSAGVEGGTPQIHSGGSHYITDRWQLNDKWSFNIGVRYDEATGVDGAAGDTGDVGTWDTGIAPRIGFAYDVKGDGGYRISASYAQYAGKYSETALQNNQTASGGTGWDGTFGFDTESRGIYIPDGGGNYRAYFGGNDLSLNLNDWFQFNRGPITTSGFFGYGQQGPGFSNNTVNIKFEYTGSCDELLTEVDLEEIIEEYKDYLWEAYGESYPVGPGQCGGRVDLKTYQQEFVYLMQNSDSFNEFFNFWELGLFPPKFGLKARLIEPLVTLDPTAPARDAGVLPDDAFYQSSGSAQKKVDDQWGLKRIGFKPAGRDGKGAIWPAQGTPTIVAVVDSGIDITHPELQGQLWANFAEIPNNGEDDDGNGLVDDVFGWNFEAFNNNVFDMYGHGTFIAGIIAAATDNGIGIAGINPWARIMPVKVSSFDGRSNNIRVAQGIYYAAEMGARVINVSFEGDIVSKVIQSAVDHATSKGALVVVAAGNRSIDVAGVSPAVMRGALTVASTGPDGEHEAYSNHGSAVDIAAPGTHIISLRASRTDLMQFEDPDYEPGSHILGESGILYHLSGTSFAAPHVAGVASLLFSMNPDLTAGQVKRMILQSARDTGTPGTDRLTGYGELDAGAALKADPDFYVDAAIDGVEVVGAALRVNGTAAADRLKSAWIELGEGENPRRFKTVGDKVKKSVRGAAITDIDVNELRGGTSWTLQLVVEHKDGTRRVNRYLLNLG